MVSSHGVLQLDKVVDRFARMKIAHDKGTVMAKCGRHQRWENARKRKMPMIVKPDCPA
jgi:hypothetical protein